MALPCMDSEGLKPKTEYDAADADDGTAVPSTEDVTMQDAPAATTTKKARPGGGIKAGGGRTAKAGGKRGAASSSVRGGVRGGGSKKKSVAAALSRTGALPPSPHVKPEPGLTPASSGVHDDSDSQEEKRGVAADDDSEEDDNDDNDDDDDDPSSSDGGASDNGPYCICRGPDDHRWMIQCDNCEDWFHGDCVQLDKEESENLIVSYICPNCAIPDLYVTRFRKLCALPGCRKPARLYAAADNAAEGPAAAAPADASAFCSDAHRDQWWEVLLERMVREAGNSAKGGAPQPEQPALAEDKMPVDQLTPAQLVAVLAHSHEPGVAQMLLHGLVQDSGAQSDALLSAEERAITDASAAERYRLAGQVAMCKKMLVLLDMAKTRNLEAAKAGHLERDGCGYDERLQHVGVQPHFAQFLGSPEGQAIFRRAAAVNGHGARDSGDSDNDKGYGAGDSDASGGRKKKRRLGPPQFDEAGQPVVVEEEEGVDGAATAATAGMCRKRKCKAHAGWFPTLARDVRIQIQECTRQAAALRDKETRIRLAAVQRAFVMQHSTSEVRHFVADADGDGDTDDDDDGDGGVDVDVDALRQDGWSARSDDDDDDDDNDDDALSSLPPSHGAAGSDDGHGSVAAALNGHGAHSRPGTDSS